jgi:PAS domain S-box-containing protein
MKFSLSMQKKGLLLVAVPLVFELVFIAELAHLKNEAEEAAARASRSSEIVVEAQALTKLAYDAANEMVLYGLLKSPTIGERFDKVLQEMDQDMAKLKKTIGSDPIQQKHLQVLAGALQNAIDLMDRFKTRIKHRDTEFTALDIPAMRSEIVNCLNDLFAATGTIVDAEKLKSTDYPDLEATAKQRTQNWLIVGVVANILVTFAMAIFFSRNITDRMAIIVKNAMQLASGGTFTSSVGGTDEVAQLNVVLNEVALLLNQASQRERAIVDNVQDAICTVAPNYTFTRVSPSAEQLWGCTEAELLGQRLGNFLSDTDKETFFKTMESAKTTASAVHFETLMLRRNGTSVWVLWSAYWSDAENSFFCVAHDVNQRKQLDQLRQDFFNMMSHDIRTPITSFKVFLHMLKEKGVYGTLNETGLNTVLRVETSVTKVDQLINDLLDVEKLETGQMRLRFEPTSSSAIIESAIEIVAPFAEQRLITIGFVKQDDIEFIADPGRLVQVFQNLLSNAIKFSSKGANVEISASPADQDKIEFQVKDFGPGIPASQQKLVFDRFRQLENADDVVQKGSGLGLAICKAIVERHGGTIGVLSQPGEGATFWVRLPQRAEATVSNNSTSSVQSS